MAIKKEKLRAISIKLPESLLEEIDQICSATYVSRASWLIRAAKALLENERRTSKEDIIAKITKMEEKMENKV